MVSLSAPFLPVTEIQLGRNIDTTIPLRTSMKFGGMDHG